MKLLVVGLGSMGKRRIRLILSLAAGHELAGVDTSEERRDAATEFFGIPCWGDLQKAISEFMPEAVLICTSPISHGPIALACLAKGLHVFTEINLLSDWYDEAMDLAGKHGVMLFVSSTFLYRKETMFIADMAQQHPRSNYIYHCGQYLPDWHPWESYKSFFVANKKTNGCREIFAIELPWIFKAFGKVTSYHAIKNKTSSLDIDYPDNYLVMLEHESGSKGIFCVDVLSRKPVRSLELFSEDIHLFWEGTPDSLSIFDIEKKQELPVSLYEVVEHQEGYAVTIIENAYLEEMKNFLGCIQGGAEPKHSLSADREVLELINRIEAGI